MKESYFQKKVRDSLIDRGCVVIKMQQSATTARGIPDLLFLHGAKYGFIECKQSAHAKFQPFQKEKVAMFNEMSFARVAYPENWDTVLREIEDFINE